MFLETKRRHPSWSGWKYHIRLVCLTGQERDLSLRVRLLLAKHTALESGHLSVSWTGCYQLLTFAYGTDNLPSLVIDARSIGTTRHPTRRTRSPPSHPAQHLVIGFTHLELHCMRHLELWGKSVGSMQSWDRARLAYSRFGDSTDLRTRNANPLSRRSLAPFISLHTPLRR